MFRCAIAGLRTVRPLIVPYYRAATILNNSPKNFSTLTKVCNHIQPKIGINISLLENKRILDIASNIDVTKRTVTKFSLNKGKRKTVKAVTRRFFRLHWGGWIRPKVGRTKKLWKKSPPQKRRLRQHVFCNSTQSFMLDKMVTKYWKRPKYYVEDPYSSYHTREEFPTTRKKPLIR